MPNELPLPEELQHLLEKRDTEVRRQGVRRAADQIPETGLSVDEPRVEQPAVERRRQSERRRRDRRKSNDQ